MGHNQERTFQEKYWLCQTTGYEKILGDVISILSSFVWNEANLQSFIMFEQSAQKPLCSLKLQISLNEYIFALAPVLYFASVLATLQVIQCPRFLSLRYFSPRSKDVIWLAQPNVSYSGNRGNTTGLCLFWSGRVGWCRRGENKTKLSPVKLSIGEVYSGEDGQGEGVLRKMQIFIKLPDI